MFHVNKKIKKTASNPAKNQIIHTALLTHNLVTKLFRKNLEYLVRKMKIITHTRTNTAIHVQSISH